MKKLSPEAESAGFVIVKGATFYAYPKNGNTGNPSARHQTWEVKRHGTLVDSATKYADALASAEEMSAAAYKAVRK